MCGHISVYMGILMQEGKYQPNCTKMLQNNKKCLNYTHIMISCCEKRRKYINTWPNYCGSTY